MYALIENQKVIGVFDENDLIANNSWQTVVPIDENCLFWLTGGNVVIGKLINDNDYEGLGDWILVPFHHWLSRHTLFLTPCKGYCKGFYTHP